MATQKKKTGRAGSWANLVICGGLSWGVNVWHALHISGDAHWTWILAVMFGTAPVVVAAIQSHQISRGNVGTVKMVITYLVFAMGMALSITAQAAAVAPFAPVYHLNWVFPIMLDVATFLSLHSLMETGPETDERTDEETAETGSQVGSQTGSQTLWKPVRGDGTENRPETALGTGSRPALGAPQRTATVPVPETTNTAAYQRVDRTAPQNGDRPETGSQNRPETGSQAGSQESEKTGSETGQRTDKRTGLRTEEKTAETGSQSRAKTPPKTGRRGKAKTREDVIREAYDAYRKEHERPISADKLMEQVRAAGFGLSKATALQILADLNSPPKLTAVK